MTAPTGGEVAIYQARTRTLEKRCVVGLTENQWTAAVEELFNAALSPVNLTYSWLSGAPAVTGGRLKIRGFGGPPFEWVASRRGWFPNDPTKAFKVEIIVAFPQSNPVYSQVITIGSIEQTFGGIEFDSARVVQAGSAYVAGAQIGRIFIHGAGTIDAVGQAYSASDHTLLVEWDPDAPGTVGAEKLTVKWNGTTIAESSDDGFVAAPRFWQIGIVHPARFNETTEAIWEGLGTLASPAVLMDVASVKVTEDGNGYEAAAWPTWTTANAGGTLDTAVAGERFSLDSVTWAKFPNAYLKSIDCGGPTREGQPALRLTLSNLQATGVDRFQTERWIGRPMFVDTRMVNDGGTATAWKRLGAYIIQSASLDGSTLELQGSNRALARLDTPIIRSWNGEAPDGSAAGQLDGVNRSYTFTEVFEDVIDLADACAGGTLAVTDNLVFAPDLVPRDLDNPGISLLQWYLSLADRLCQEVWVNHTTSGTGRYGRIRTHLWTFGSGTSAWTFYGRGGASRSEIRGHGPNLVLNGRGPGQAYYRQDNPLETEDFLTLQMIPLVGQFPGGTYPDTGRALDESLAEVSTTGLSPLVSFPDRDFDDHFGGVAYFRYLQENLERRRVEFEVVNHDWMEVGDEIAISDPDGRGLTTAETWVIASVSYRFDNQNRLLASINAVTSSIVKATDVAA